MKFSPRSAVRIITCGGFCKCATCSSRPKPSRLGMTMSQTTMSGFSRAICRSAASPSTAVPTTVISAYSLRESDNTPSCNVLSSQINTRITRSLCRSCIFCFTFRHHTFRDILSISYLGTFWKFFLRINRKLLSDKKMHIKLHKSDISRHACNRKIHPHGFPWRWIFRMHLTAWRSPPGW